MFNGVMFSLFIIIMDASDVKISHVFDNIKAQVYKRNKEIYAPVEAKKIGLEKLSPFLENIQTVSNHNLAVATQAQALNQQLNQQLVEQQTHIDKLKRKNHRAKKEITQLKSQLITVQTKLNNELSQIHNEITAKETVIQQKNAMINKLEDDVQTMKVKNTQQDENHTKAKQVWMNSADQYNEQLRIWQTKHEVLNTELQNLTRVNNTQQLKINNLENHIDKLSSLQVQEKQDNEQKNNEWLSQLKTRESKLEAEIRQHENRKSELTVIQRQFQEITVQNEKLVQEMDQLKLQNQLLLDKNQKLQNDAEVNFREKVKDINESFIVRLTNLEAQLQLVQKENETQTLKIAHLTHQLKVSEASRDILQKECDQFELSFDVQKKEKEMYLGEFKNLRDKYQSTIDKLDGEVRRLSLNYKITQEDNKSLEQQCDHYRQRLQELMDLHELAALDQDESFYHVLQMLKTRGIGNVTKEEMQTIRNDVMEHMAANKTVRMVQKQLDRAQFQVQIRDEELPEEPNTRSEWDDIYKNLDKIGKGY